MNKLFLKPEPKFHALDNKKYKIKAIKNSILYAKKPEKYLLSLYYFIFWKNYLEKKYLETFFCNYILSKNDFYISQKIFKKANGNFFFL